MIYLCLSDRLLGWKRRFSMALRARRPARRRIHWRIALRRSPVSPGSWPAMAGPPTTAGTEVMRPALAHAPRLGTVVVGKGAKDEAPILFASDRVRHVASVS